MNLDLALVALEQGMAFGIMALGVYITFRILNFADLTVDGSLPLGAAVSAKMIVSGYDPVASVLVAIAAGGAAGAVTGLLHTRLKIAPLLSGIITMTALYSINLRVMGSPNIPLLNIDTIFDTLSFLSYPWNNLIILVLLAFVIKLALDAFLNTLLGFALRATGDNPQMLKSLGTSTATTKLIGLVVANALVALSGALVCQFQRFSDVGMGIGTIIAGLASVIIGEVIIGKSKFLNTTTGVIIGSFIYRFIIGFALTLGFKASDLKLLTAILVVFLLVTPRIKKLIRGD